MRRRHHHSGKHQRYPKEEANLVKLKDSGIAVKQAYLSERLYLRMEICSCACLGKLPNALQQRILWHSVDIFSARTQYVPDGQNIKKANKNIHILYVIHVLSCNRTISWLEGWQLVGWKHPETALKPSGLFDTVVENRFQQLAQISIFFADAIHRLLIASELVGGSKRPNR